MAESPRSAVVLDASFLGDQTEAVASALTRAGHTVTRARQADNALALALSAYWSFRVGTPVAGRPVLFSDADTVQRCLGHLAGTLDGARIQTPAALLPFMAGRAVRDAWSRIPEVVALSGAEPFDLSGSAPWIDQERRRGLKVWCASRKRLAPAQWLPDTPIILAEWRDFDAEYRCYVRDGVVAGISDRMDPGLIDTQEIERIGVIVHRGRRDARWIISDLRDYADMIIHAWPAEIARPPAFALDIGYRVRNNRWNLIGVRDPAGMRFIPSGSDDRLVSAYADMVVRRWDAFSGSAAC